jgi:flagellar hook-associated protein 1 FlgK
MGSTFGGINTALTSLYAQRRGLDVAGQNIANANSEGYTRQRVRMAAQTGTMHPGIYTTTDQVGAGVTVTGVERNRNEYLDARGRIEHGTSAYMASQKSAYDQIESILAEPSDTALQARMHDMWDAWNDVANNWQDPSTRSALLERSRTVAITLNDAHSQLSTQFDAMHNETGAFVDQVNKLGASIASMNEQIVVATQTGTPANELMDTRDNAVNQLAELVGATAQAKPNGAMNVYIGNTSLVESFSTRTLRVAGPTTLDGITATDKVALQWTDTGATATPGGTMGGMLDTMNSVVPGIVSELDNVASSLASTVNTAMVGDGTPAHPPGYTADGMVGTTSGRTPSTGIPMFTGTTAGSITVAIADPADVAFSRGNPLDPTTPALDHGAADGLSGTGSSSSGPDAVYRTLIGQLGVSAQAAGRRSEIQDSVTEQVDVSRQAESGVNLDEEMTHLLTFQRGYEAASRVLTTVDSMLDQLINRTGLVGR